MTEETDEAVTGGDTGADEVRTGTTFNIWGLRPVKKSRIMEHIIKYAWLEKISIHGGYIYAQVLLRTVEANAT